MKTLAESEGEAVKERPEPEAEDAPKGSFHLLFVCTGNTCRSPMAQGLALQMLEDRGWSQVEARSAGVAAPEGSPASEGALRAAARHGIDLASHRSTQLTPDLVDWADLILTMSVGHLALVEVFGGKRKAELITRFGGDPEGTVAARSGVLDPIGGDETVYEQTFEQLRELVNRILDHLALDEPR